MLVQPAKSVTALIAQPPLVDILVKAWLDTYHPCPIVQVGPVEHVVHVDIASLATAVTDGGCTREVPDPGLEAEVFFGQGSDRTDVDHVGRVGIVEYIAGVDSQLRSVSAVEDPELARLGDLIGESHAT